MSRDDAVLSAYERLLDAFAADLLDMPEEEVLASHTPAAARVAADAFRRRSHRTSPDRAVVEAPPAPPPGPSPDVADWPEKKP